MDRDSLVGLGIVGACGFGAVGAFGGAALTYALMRIASLARQMEQMAHQHRPRSKFEQDADLDRRAQAMNVATLQRLAAKDQLEALRMLSPEMAREVAREFLPE